MNTVPKTQAAPAQVLAEALLNAGRELGLTQKELTDVIGRTRSSISRNGIDPNSSAGQLALLVVRVYRSLFVLVGGDSGQMKHWMHTVNRHTGGVPAEQVRSIQGLVQVVEYLDAMRGKV